MSYPPIVFPLRSNARTTKGFPQSVRSISSGTAASASDQVGPIMPPLRSIRAGDFRIGGG
jgi:hypothetical protein